MERSLVDWMEDVFKTTIEASNQVAAVPLEQITLKCLTQVGRTLVKKAMHLIAILDESYEGEYREPMSAMFEFSVYGYPMEYKAFLNAFVTGSLCAAGLFQRFSVCFADSTVNACCVMTVAERYGRGSEEEEEGGDTGEP